MERALEKRDIPRICQAVTFLGFGALEIGRDWGIGTGTETQRPDELSAGLLLNTVLDKGINLIDTARAYHKSEERIGKYLNARRSEYILTSKCGEHSQEPNTYYDFSYRAVSESIDLSLELLKTNVIDIMQIHFGPNPKKVLENGETIRAMKDAQRKGKIRFLGASVDGDLARRCIESNDFDVMQMEYNLLNRENEENIKLCKQKGIGVFIRGGLARGLLTSKIVPHLNELDNENRKKVEQLFQFTGGDGELVTALAMRFLYDNPGISSVLVGTKNIERIGRNIQLLSEEIDGELIRKAAEVIKC